MRLAGAEQQGCWAQDSGRHAPLSLDLKGWVDCRGLDEGRLGQVFDSAQPSTPAPLRASFSQRQTRADPTPAPTASPPVIAQRNAPPSSATHSFGCRAFAVNQALEEQGLVPALAALHRRYGNDFDPANGARVVARAWVDREYRRTVVARRHSGLRPVPATRGRGSTSRALENTPDPAKNVIVTRSCAWRCSASCPTEFKELVPRPGGRESLSCGNGPRSAS
ncbi:nitrile hydratase subunit alpha [Pseudomonas peli]|uniref:nitrile hydratase subunit alpha n=1 Tax=Pseudomonas peli TaxID=592361 RepID=UPI003D15A0BB